MPTRISCMYPGSSGASRNLNMMSEGNGNNKWQGLPGLTNLRSSLVVPVTTRAYGTNRDKVFCINQLGGVGRFSNMFASVADGVKLPCQGSNKGSPIRSIMGKNVTNFTETFGNSPFWFDITNMTVSDIQKKLYEIYNKLNSYSEYLNELANKTYGGYVLIPITTTTRSDINWSTPDFNSDDGSNPSGDAVVLWMAYLGDQFNKWHYKNSDGFFSPTISNQGTPSDGSEVGVRTDKLSSVFNSTDTYIY